MIEVLGHERQRELLSRLSAQTLLFTGPEGVGRRTVARWYAWGLNCAQGFPPCGRCASCRLDPHPDYREIAPQEETQGGRRARQEQIRLEQLVPQGEESLEEWLSVHPRFRVRVAVIDGAHLLSEPAANALLKLLEEPPPTARLILIAPARELLLPTLASRALELSFGPLPEALLAGRGPVAWAQGSLGRLVWLQAHPEELSQFEADLEAVAKGLKGRWDDLFLALQHLLSAYREAPLDPLMALAHRLERELPEGRWARLLMVLLEVQEAFQAYGSEELLVSYLALSLRGLVG